MRLPRLLPTPPTQSPAPFPSTRVPLRTHPPQPDPARHCRAGAARTAAAQTRRLWVGGGRWRGGREGGGLSLPPPPGDCVWKELKTDWRGNRDRWPVVWLQKNGYIGSEGLVKVGCTLYAQLRSNEVMSQSSLLAFLSIQPRITCPRNDATRSESRVPRVC